MSTQLWKQNTEGEPVGGSLQGEAAEVMFSACNTESKITKTEQAINTWCYTFVAPV